MLRTIPGIGGRAAQVIISEIGVDMSRFPTAAHLASRAGLCPGSKESAGRHRSGKTRKGNKELTEILSECAGAAGRTSTYVGSRLRRMHRRFGKKGGSKAATAIACTLIVIIWHVLHDTPNTATSALTTSSASIVPTQGRTGLSASSAPSATRSPSNPPPDRPRPSPARPGFAGC
jgi:hypothetical protein